MAVDILKFEIIKHGLIYLSEEMGVALKKSAYSPNIRERADHSCAVLDSKCRIIGQAEHIPVHIGSLPIGVSNTMKYLDENNVELYEGDMIMVNDPYIAGTHLNDVTLIRPVFHRGELSALIANKAHHVDVGGVSPASISYNSSELQHEGFVIPPVKVMENDRIKMDVVRILAANSRTPANIMGDLRAQVAANLLGEMRFKEIFQKYSFETFQQSLDYILETNYRLVLSEYRLMPKGVWRGVDYIELDDDLLKLEAEVRMDGEGFSVDFTGTSTQVDKPLNAVYGVTCAAVLFAVRTLLSENIMLNDGFTRTVQIHAPECTVVNPVKPAPVSGGNLETSQRIVDVIYMALAQAIPEKIPAASHGSMNNLMMGGVHPVSGEKWAFYETIGGGYGGRYNLDGVDGVQTNMTNTMNTPIEVIEHYYPVRFESYSFREGSGGRGRWSGGMGLERAFTALAKIQVQVLGDRGRIPPWGLAGGEPGKPSEYLVRRADGRVEKLKSKDGTILNQGDTLIIRTAGGGGYGRPELGRPGRQPYE